MKRNVLDVTAFGARPDGTTDCTTAIQRAIDECHASGGGTVLVPGGGTYMTYTLSLKSNVRLEIDRGATLMGGPDALKYPEFGPSAHWNSERAVRLNKRALFYTVGQTNVAITGRGTIDGNADAFHERIPGLAPDGRPRWRRKSDTLITGRCVFFAACRDVQVDDILLHNTCGWCTWFLDCDRVRVRGVRIEAHPVYPNGDGLHFGGCRDVVVSDCVVNSQDDAFIVRAHQEQMKTPRPCERVVVANCVFNSTRSCAIRLGWTEDYAIRDVSFDNIVCTRSHLGVTLQIPEFSDKSNIDPPRNPAKGVFPPQRPNLPFSAENIRFSNMQVASDNEPLVVSVAATARVDFLRGFSFSNCRFVSSCPPVIAVRPEDNVSGWRFSNVEFEFVPRPGGDGCTHSAGHHGWFDHCEDFTFDNVKWTWRKPKAAPAGAKAPPADGAAGNAAGAAAFPDGAKYMVVDLSGGPDAPAWPVSYLRDVPEGGWTDEYKTERLVMRLVPPGTFNMGSPEGETGHNWRAGETLHRVTLTRPFGIGVFEVTQRQWQLVTGETRPGDKGDARPVGKVSYGMVRGTEVGAGWPVHGGVDADSFMGRLRAKTNVAFDLPTEAQWEYACRAGTETALNSGKNLTATGIDAAMAEVGRYAGNVGDGRGGYSGSHTTVGSYLPNAWGLYDMHGNVAEWCLDRWEDDLGAADRTDPKGGETSDIRVLRGGCWGGSVDAGDSGCAAACRSAYRSASYYNCFTPPGYVHAFMGFRAACPAADAHSAGRAPALRPVSDALRRKEPEDGRSREERF